MAETQIFVSSFDVLFPLPRTALTKSRFLAVALSGQFREQNIVNLNLSDEFRPAFGYVYDRLRDEPAQITLDTLLGIIVLAEYLQIDSIYDEIFQYILQGNVSQEWLINNYDYYSRIPPINLAAASYIISQNSNYANLPDWVRLIFDQYITRNLPTNGEPVLLRLHPRQRGQLPLLTLEEGVSVPIPPDYYNECRMRSANSNVGYIPAENIVDAIANEYKIYRYKAPDDTYHYIYCRDNPRGFRMDSQGPIHTNMRIVQSPSTGQYWPCCVQGETSLEQNDILRLIADPRELFPDEDKKVMISDDGIIVFVSYDYEGDYIYATQYKLLPEFNIIII